MDSTSDKVTEHVSGDDRPQGGGTTKTCPLLSAGLASGVGKNRHLPCLGEDCAWWDDAAGCCAVLAT